MAGVRYFSCPEKHGLFARPENVSRAGMKPAVTVARRKSLSTPPAAAASAVLRTDALATLTAEGGPIIMSKQRRLSRTSVASAPASQGGHTRTRSASSPLDLAAVHVMQGNRTPRGSVHVVAGAEKEKKTDTNSSSNIGTSSSNSVASAVRVKKTKPVAAPRQSASGGEGHPKPAASAKSKTKAKTNKSKDKTKRSKEHKDESACAGDASASARDESASAGDAQSSRSTRSVLERERQRQLERFVREYPLIDEKDDDGKDYRLGCVDIKELREAIEKDPSFLFRRDAKLNTRLHFIVEEVGLHSAEGTAQACAALVFLLQNGLVAHIHARNKHGETAVVAATRCRRWPIVELLVAAGGDVLEKGGNGAQNSAFEFAHTFKEGNDALRRGLHRHKLNRLAVANGNAQAMLAPEWFHKQSFLNRTLRERVPEAEAYLIKLLVEDEGANINAVDKDGNSALHVFAASSRKILLLDYLIRMGGNVHAKNAVCCTCVFPSGGFLSFLQSMRVVFFSFLPFFSFLSFFLIFLLRWFHFL